MIHVRPLLFGLALAAASAACESSPRHADDVPAPPRVRVEVNARGYEPATVPVTAGRPVTLVFVRTTDEGCGQQLVLPELGIRRDLPLDTEVPVTITPRAGEFRITCGMDMYRGTIVAR